MTRIPVVEDDRDIRELLMDTLSDMGHEVIDAEDGGAGLRRALKELPDIILLDVMMPVMDGFQLLEKLKEDLNTGNHGERPEPGTGYPGGDEGRSVGLHHQALGTR